MLDSSFQQKINLNEMNEMKLNIYQGSGSQFIIKNKRTEKIIVGDFINKSGENVLKFSIQFW